jgi:uncharacterized protein (TIGR02757 family)
VTDTVSPPGAREKLEALYARYNDRRFVHPDPLEFLYRFDDPGDREIAGLVASCLAYGRVSQILKSVAFVLDRMESPRLFVQNISSPRRCLAFSGFRHRFTSGEELTAMLSGLAGILNRYGSLEACFRRGLRKSDDNVLPALALFVQEFSMGAGRSAFSLLPCPGKGSACKRLHLFLRWMVRRDAVDPGGWDSVPKSKLIVPLDTHMHRICGALRLRNRKQADGRTAVEITEAFKTIAPDDPVRYDFALTRLGILREDAPFQGFPARRRKGDPPKRIAGR